MIVNYDIQKIRAALKDFYNATGINMDLFKTDLSAVSNRNQWESNRYCKCVQDTAEGKKACQLADAQLLARCRESRQLEMHVCHAGLVDVAVPILYNETLLGYIIFGQMKNDTDFAAAQNYLSGLGLDTQTMHTYFEDIPFFDSEKIQSVVRIASMLVKHILLENMLKPDYDESVQKAVAFINENLERDLSVKIISKGAGVSKSVLYKRFHACFDCTVSEYINIRRVERAAQLLKKTDLSVEQISQQVGFTNASYFSKTFKKQMGIAPLKYRKVK